MKLQKTTGIAAKLALLVLALTLLLPGLALADETPEGGDMLTFSMYKASSVIKPGQESTITLSFSNISTNSAYYAYAILTCSDSDTKLFGDNGGNYLSRDIGTLNRNDITNLDFTFTPSADLKSGEYDMTVLLVYKNRQGFSGTKEFNITVMVDSGTPVDLQIPESSIPGGKAVYGQDFDLNFTLTNNGDTTARDVRLSLTNLSKDTLFQSGSYDSPTFPEIKSHEARQLTFKLHASENIADGYYPVEITLNYKDNGDDKTEKRTLYVEVQGSPDADEDENGNKLSVPRVVLAGFNMPPTVNMGEPFTFSFTLKNTSTDRTVKNLQASLSSSEGTVLPASGSNSFYVAEIKPGGSTTLTLQLTTKYDAEKTSYPLEIKMDYEDAKANPYSNAENLTIPVFLPTKLVLQNENYPEYGTVGEGQYLSLEYINKGKGMIYNLNIAVEGDLQADAPSTYIGNVNSGDTDSFEVMVTPLAAGVATGRLVLTYEDAAGNELSTEKTFSMTVEEPPVIDPGMEDPGMVDPGMDEGGGFPTWAKILLGVVVVAAAATALVIFRKKRKAKKQAAEEALFAENNDLD